MGEIRDIINGPLGHAFNYAFKCMGIAEDEIAAARPALTPAQNMEAFRIACPPPVMRGKVDAVYRHHIRELIGRVQRGEDTCLGTEAEVLCHVSGASLTAPLNAAGSALAAYLFARVMPDARVGKPPPEFYAGQIQNDLAAARKRAASTNRGGGA